MGGGGEDEMAGCDGAKSAASMEEEVEQVLEAAGCAVRHGREEPIHEIELQHRGRHGDEYGLKGRHGEPIHEIVLDFFQDDFPDMDIISISGCGKSVACEVVIKEEVVKKVLKTNVQSHDECL